MKFTMANVNAKKKKYTAVSTFSGCGGSSLGYKMAGFKMLWANEFIPAAQDTYEANHIGTYLDKRDIRKVKPEEILKKIGLKKGELDLFDGSPPCSAFSTAGARDKGWGTVKKYSDSKQRVDDLFYEYIRILKGLQPKVFVAENVPGLASGKAKGYFVEIFRLLQGAGYVVEARILDASQLGVPQARKRLIFVGVRKDLKMKPVFPQPLSRVISVNDVCPNIAYIKTKKDGQMKYVPANIPSPTITASDSTNSETAQFSCGGFIETQDGEQRKYKISELKKIFTFPPDFELTGKFEQKWERLGRSVPPMFMYHVAKTIGKEILDKL
jgi:DNA (cytosine-5)-methyltransferase 1